MTLVPFLNCCSILGVDPKTLRLWLKAAHLSCTAHPTDARLKCLTRSQLHHLADLHGRCLLHSLEKQASLLPQKRPPSHSPASRVPQVGHSFLTRTCTTSSACCKLGLLPLEAHGTELALALMRERATPPSACAGPLLSPPPTSPIRVTALAPHSHSPLPCEAAPPPVRHRSPSRVHPLIAYRMDGTYLVLSPTEGVLAFAPDSAEWFDWLATITAFTFVGAHGRFSARRKSLHRQFTRCWRAYRVVHGHQYWFYVGLTDHLTLARLEQVAVTIQTRLAAL